MGDGDGDVGGKKQPRRNDVTWALTRNKHTLASGCERAASLIKSDRSTKPS